MLLSVDAVHFRWLYKTKKELKEDTEMMETRKRLIKNEMATGREKGLIQNRIAE